MKQKLTFDQLLNKYTKAVPKDRSLKKNQGHLCIKANLHILEENLASAEEMSPPYSLLRRCILLCHGRRRHQILLAQRGSAKGFGCDAIRCRIHYLTRGEETSEDLCLIG